MMDLLEDFFNYLRYAAFRKTCHCPGCRNAVDPWTRA